MVQLKKALHLSQFPKSSKHDAMWLCENEMGPCSIWLTEFLTNDMILKPGMKILDMGCGKAMSSIFLAKEFGVTVFANDLWINATENYKRIKEAGVEHLVFPIQAEAHLLPYANDFFDAIISVDSYHYYGTDEMYLSYFIKFLKRGGQFGFISPGIKKEFNSKVPVNLQLYWENYNFTFHTPEWWKNLFIRSGDVEVEFMDYLPDGFKIWLYWDKTLKSRNLLKRTGDVEMLETDGGEHFDIVRIISRKIN